MTNRLRWIYFLLVAALFLSGFYMQSKLYLSPDVTWLLYATKEMLSGKQYGTYIFETNPPMILWLSVPVVLLQRILPLSMHQVFMIYIYIINILSLSLYFALSGRAFPESRGDVSDCVIKLTLVTGILFLPLYAFGQRDILWVTLILPWLGAVFCRLNRQPIYRWEAVTAGIMAGLGFALKPYFLFVLCLVEGYVLFRSRRLFGWWRIETALILAIFMCYLGAIALLQPGYFDTVLPLVMRYYFKSAIQPWGMILTVPFILFAISVAVYYILFQSFDRYPVQGRVLLLTLSGTILSYAFARTPWYYHVCPALIMGCVLLVYITVQIIEQGVGGWKNIYNVLIPSIMAALMLSLPFSTIIRGLSENATALQPLEPVAAIIRSDSQSAMTVHAMSIHTGGDTIVPADMAGAQFVSGMPFFWWYGGLLTSEMLHLQSLEQLKKDRTFLTDITYREIMQAKPQWLVSNGEGQPLISERINKRHTIGWFQNMLLNERLKTAFQCYRMYALSGRYRIYKRIDHCA